MPFLEMIKELDSKELCIPTDRLIRTSDAAKILGVSKAAISTFVNAGLLTPLYVNSEQRRFWLSEVKALPRTVAWKLETKL